MKLSPWGYTQFVYFWCRSPDIRPLLSLKEVMIWKKLDNRCIRSNTWSSLHEKVSTHPSWKHTLLFPLLWELWIDAGMAWVLSLFLRSFVSNGVPRFTPMWRFILCHASAVAFFVPLDSSSIQVPSFEKHLRWFSKSQPWINMARHT